VKKAISAVLGLAMSGPGIVTSTIALQHVLRIASTVVLTRLLSPEAFGAVGIVMAVTYIAAMISDVGFQAYVIRHEDGNEPHFLNAVWTLRLARSACLCLLVALAAYPVTSYLEKPELLYPIIFSASLFLTDALTSLSLITAVRNGQLLKVSALDLVLALTQISLSVLFAVILQNYWAILISMLITSLFKIALSYSMFEYSKHSLLWDFFVLKELWRFAKFIFLSSLVTLVISQADRIVLSKLMGLDEFGLYVLATSIAAAPVALSIAYASKVLYPTYSSAWREAGIGGIALALESRKQWFVAAYSFSASCLIGSAPMIIGILYDQRYDAAAGYLQILAINSSLALAVAAGNEALVASGRPQTTLATNLARLAWLSSMPFAYSWGGSRGLIFVVGTMELAALMCIWLSLRRAGLFRLRRELLPLLAAAFGAIVSVALFQ
jgi:O-antigen/teichoic acid export membrane protein